MKNGLSVLMGVVALGAAVSASADVVRINFNGTDGVTSALCWNEDVGWGSLNQNTGAESGHIKLSLPANDWYFPAALFKPVLPANLAGATITSATLTMLEDWGNHATYMGVEIRRVTTPWVAGSGLATNRSGTSDTGAGKYFSNYDPTTYGDGKGLAWDGTVRSMYDIRDAAHAFGAVGMDTSAPISSTDYVGDGFSDFSLLSWAQGIAAGTYTNNGFAIWMGNATQVFGGNTLSYTTARPDTGLVLDYTPAVPEPATVGLLTTGSLVLLRRRRRA